MSAKNFSPQENLSLMLFFTFGCGGLLSHTNEIFLNSLLEKEMPNESVEKVYFEIHTPFPVYNLNF